MSTAVIDQIENIAPVENQIKTITTSAKSSETTLTDVTKKLNTANAAPAPAQWCGKHVKYDDDGNEVTMIKTETLSVVAPAISAPANIETEAEVEAENESTSEERAVEAEAEAENETTDDASKWEYRTESSLIEKKNLKWQGKRYVYNDDGEEQEVTLKEEDFEEKETTQEIEAVSEMLLELRHQ